MESTHPRLTHTRLTHPLVRDSRDEPLRQASWEEALDRAARGLAGHRGAFGLLSGARATNETHYVAQKFARVVMGSHNIDSCDRASHAPSVAGLGAAFGSGGGTSSYEEIAHTDVVVMWGSDARSTHPVFFQHVLRGIRNGARLYVVDPRRTSTAEWAESWLGPDVGTDIAMAHAIGREIIHAGLANEVFVERATSGFEDYKALVEPWTLALAERVTGVPARATRELAHAYARAERAQLCWSLGVTGHDHGTDTVRALINLALLTGQVGRYGAGLQPLCGQSNVQGGGDMGAVPHRLPGFQDILDPEARRKFESAWDTAVPPHYGLNLTEMFDAMDEGTLKALYCVGENPARSEPDDERTVRRLKALDVLVVQDAFLTRTAQLADVVLPATAGWAAETEGTVTSGERRVRRVRRAVTPPGEARADIDILRDLAGRLGHGWTYADSEDVWNELRSLSPDHHGMTYARLEEHQGLQWPCPDPTRLQPPYLHGRLWERDRVRRGRKAPFGIVQHRPSVDRTDERYPIRLISGQRPDPHSRGRYSPPNHVAYIELGPEDAERYGVVADEEVQVSSRHGSVVALVRIDTALRPGLARTTLFKAAAIRIEKLPVATVVG